jgi:hypothetical protein
VPRRGAERRRRAQRSGAAHGTTDIGAGLKYVFAYTPKFSIGGQAFFTFPTGSESVAAGANQATYALNAAYAFNSVLSVGAAASFG